MLDHVVFESNPDEPIGDEVPVADAMEQRLEVGDTADLPETFEPTEANEFASTGAPVDVDPADWQEQQTTASGDWDLEVDR
ncbi:MAG: hypothetical protein QOH60_480 [Mycobacterium sp.]|jgi:hypothetical protein|nr:hypothetical protein [Mycobacterium sp.]